MSNQDQAVAKPSASSQMERTTIKSLLTRPEYQSRFKEVLGKRANQFVASVISLGNTLPRDVDPPSVVASAMTAAVLDLPVDKNLGFAWIVPYKKSGVMYGQFQMGYKGYIQLALRSGQYKRMNAKAVNKEAVGGYDAAGEPIIHWDKLDETKDVVGYVFAFEMVNGFTKVAYWTREKVEAHAKRYSQAYKSGYETPWKSNFDRMALKTVIKNELSAWGILSIEMQSALKFDQSVQKDVGAEPEFVDGAEPGVAAPDFDRMKSAGKAELGDALAGGSTTAPTPEDPKVVLNREMTEAGVLFDDFRDYVSNTNLAKDADSWGSFEEVPADLALKLVSDSKAMAKIIKTYGKKKNS